MKLETPTSGSELTAEAVAVLEKGHKAIPPTFVRDLYGRVPSEDLAPYSPKTLADLAAEAFEHLKASRTADGADIRLFDFEIEREGRRQDVTVLEIVNDNMPSCSIRPSPRSWTRAMSRCSSPTRSWRWSGMRAAPSCASSARPRPPCGSA
jgi:hypothetical protein